MHPVMHSLLAAALLLLSCQALCQSSVPVIPATLAPHVSELKQEMLLQLSRTQSCFPRVRFLLEDSVLPIGLGPNDKPPGVDPKSALIRMISLGRGLFDQNKLRGSVISSCQSPLKHDGKHYPFLILLIVESPTTDPITVSVPIEKGASGSFAIVADDIILPASQLVVPK